MSRRTTAQKLLRPRPPMQDAFDMDLSQTSHARASIFDRLMTWIYKLVAPHTGAWIETGIL